MNIDNAHRLLVGTLSLILVAGFANPAFAGGPPGLVASVTDVQTSSAAACAPDGTKKFDIVIEWSPSNMSPDHYHVEYLEGTNVWFPAQCAEGPLNGTFADNIDPNGPLTLPGADGEFCSINNESCSPENPIRGLFGQLTCGSSIIVSVIAMDDENEVIVESNPLTITNNCNTVAGELMPLNTTALFISGITSSGIWMVPTIVGLTGAGIFLVKFRKN